MHQHRERMDYNPWRANGLIEPSWTETVGIPSREQAELAECKQRGKTTATPNYLQLGFRPRRILCTIIKDRGISTDWKDGRQTVALSTHPLHRPELGTKVLTFKHIKEAIY